MNTLIEYIRIHLISLEQDLAELSDSMEVLDPNCKDFAELDFEYNIKSGEITASRHILSVAEGMIEQ